MMISQVFCILVTSNPGKMRCGQSQNGAHNKVIRKSDCQQTVDDMVSPICFPSVRKRENGAAQIVLLITIRTYLGIFCAHGVQLLKPRRWRSIDRPMIWWINRRSVRDNPYQPLRGQFKSSGNGGTPVICQLSISISISGDMRRSGNFRVLDDSSCAAATSI